MISLLDATRSKVEHVLQRVRGLRPHSPSQEDVNEALKAIESTLTSHRETLNGLASTGVTGEVVARHCRVVLGELFSLLSILGFLHRAQHPCNPFEAYDPLRRLAREVIGADARIVISSEWDFYPYTIVSPQGLPNFVFVGLPASESDNGFLLPLAGHEFGHSLWRKNDEATKYKQRIVTELISQIRLRWEEFRSKFPHVQNELALTTEAAVVESWRPAWRIANRQVEEIYCDLVGLRLFGDSYLKAFAWLLAPGMDEHRSDYPLASARAKILVKASDEWGVSVPDGFLDYFGLEPGPSELIHEIADASSLAVAEDLCVGVDEYLSSRNQPLPREDVVDRIASRLKFAAPSVDHATLQELLCGAWRVRDDPTLWASELHLARGRERIINELLLKSAQCLEWRFRMEAA